MKRFYLLPLILTLFLVPAAIADEPLKVENEHYTLPNGLKVVLHEDHSIPMVSVNVWYRVGSKNEEPGRTGFAHLFEHMMFQGSKHYNDDYFTPIQTVGGEVNGSTTEDRTNYWENLPSNYLELGLAMESDRMAYLLDAMTQEKLDNQRDVVKNERRQGVENEPYGITEDLFPVLMYPKGHPYSWTVIGSMEDLSAASMDDVKNFFRRYYTPNNASLCVAGDFDPAQAKALIEKYFGSIPPGPDVTRMTEWVPEITEERRAQLEDDVQLPRLYYLWHTPGLFKPGDAEADLLANILGSGKTSRLYSSLVYEKQLAQELNVYQASRELSSVFTIIATAKPGHTLDEIEKAIDAELNKLFNEGITVQELAQSRTNWEASFVRGLQNVGGFYGRADRLNQYNSMLGNPDMFQWDLDRYLKPTAADINAFAKEFLAFNRRGVVHVNPRGTIAAAGEEIDRSVPPTAGAEPSFTPPSIQHETLSNGLQIYLVEDHRLPLVDMQLVVARGYNSDPVGKFGLASFTADMMNEGTKSLSALEFADTTKMLGAYINSGASYEESFISLNVIRKHFEDGLGLVAEVALNPTFPDDEIERLRKNYLANLQQESRQPFPTAYRVFRTLIYGEDNTCGQAHTGSGSQKFLESLTRQDLVSFYETNFKPNVAAVVITGDVTMAEAKKAIESKLGKWKQGDAPAPNLPQATTDLTPTIYIVDRPGSEQSMIIAGHLGAKRNGPDFTGIGVMNRPLGGQFMARINMNLREDKGYTYGSFCAFAAGNYGAPFFAYAPVQSEFTAQSVAELLKELKGVVGDNPLTPEELATSRDGLIKSYPQNFENLSSITGQIADIFVYNLPVDEWATYASRVEKVTDADVARLAKQYIRPDSMIVVVVGDRAKIEQGLRDLDFGEVVTLGDPM